MSSLIKANLVVLLLSILLMSCGTQTPKINFGKDMCAFCKMTVIDEKFGALLINDKGKTLCFDCCECMVNYMKMDKGFNADKKLIVNYNQPKELIDAEKAYYLYGEAVRSPMGGNVAAFNTRETAETFQKKLEGKILLWNKVLEINF